MKKDNKILVFLKKLLVPIIFFISLIATFIIYVANLFLVSNEKTKELKKDINNNIKNNTSNIKNNKETIKKIDKEIKEIRNEKDEIDTSHSDIKSIKFK